jgi:hypothetical protein
VSFVKIALLLEFLTDHLSLNVGEALDDFCNMRDRKQLLTTSSYIKEKMPELGMFLKPVDANHPFEPQPGIQMRRISLYQKQPAGSLQAELISVLIKIAWGSFVALYLIIPMVIMVFYGSRTVTISVTCGFIWLWAMSLAS